MFMNVIATVLPLAGLIKTDDKKWFAEPCMQVYFSFPD